MKHAGFLLITGACLVLGCGEDGGDTLEQTGLYDEVVWELTPQFASWSDGATKRRWLHLPAGEVINTDDMDNWVFPVGTRAWKEFVRDGVNGLVCGAAKPRQIARAFDSLFGDRSRAQSMGERGKQAIAGVGWDRVIDELTSTLPR